MPRIRYNGPDEARDLAMPGGVITCPRGEWVDAVDAAVAGGIPEHHAQIAALAVADAPDWEVEADKPRKSRSTEPDDKEHDR